MASEIFANFSGTSLIILLWTTGFFLPYVPFILLCKVRSKLTLVSLVNYFDIQYLGMGILFLHISKREDLEFDLKEKIVMIVFAPVMQMTFLASFIYYWRRGDAEKKVEIIFMGITYK